jgi:hypothetical protein
MIEKIIIETLIRGQWYPQADMTGLDINKILKLQQYVEYTLGIPARIVWEK